METNQTIEINDLKKIRIKIKKDDLYEEAQQLTNKLYKIAKNKKISIDDALLEYLRINENYISILECKEKLENDEHWISYVNYQFLDRNAYNLLDEFTNMLLIKGYDLCTESSFKKYFINYYNYIKRH